MSTLTLSPLRLSNLSKTWEFSVNNNVAYTSQILNAKAILFRLKEELKALTGATVVRSCDSTAVTEGSDTITAYDNGTSVAVNSDGTAHSWIVIQMVTGAQILVSWVVGNTTSPTQIKVFVSPGGLFTSGSTTHDPTASDGYGAASGGTSSFSYFGANDFYWSRGRTTDGKSFYLAVHGNNTTNQCGLIGFFDHEQIDQSKAFGPVYVNMNVAAAPNFFGAVYKLSGGASTTGALTVDAMTGNGDTVAAQTAYGSVKPCYQFSLYDASASPFAVCCNGLTDVWSTHTTGDSTAVFDYAPSTGEKEFICIANTTRAVYIPWGGAAISF